MEKTSTKDLLELSIILPDGSVISGSSIGTKGNIYHGNVFEDKILTNQRFMSVPFSYRKDIPFISEDNMIALIKMGLIVICTCIEVKVDSDSSLTGIECFQSYKDQIFDRTSYANLFDRSQEQKISDVTGVTQVTDNIVFCVPKYRTPEQEKSLDQMMKIGERYHEQMVDVEGEQCPFFSIQDFREYEKKLDQLNGLQRKRSI